MKDVVPDWLADDRFRFRRFLDSYALPKREKGHCRWCGQPVPAGRRSWCSEACVDSFKVRAWSNEVQLRVGARDHGICARCGIDTLEVRNLMRACWRTTRQRDFSYFLQWGAWKHDFNRALWEADHIIPVTEGGGCCGLSNYQTLCLPCHKLDTAALAARTAQGRKTQGVLV